MPYNSKEKIREYTRNRMAKVRAEWLTANGPCAYCGSWEQLEVDHIDPSTKDPLLRTQGSGFWNWSKARREAELAKCQVLCRKCHRQRTNAQLTKTHCVRGHEFTAENSYSKNGSPRQCAACRAIRRKSD